MTITTALPDSMRAELPQALHNFTTGTGHIFKCALIADPQNGDYDNSTTNYSDLTGNSDEVSGPGYTIGGFAWSAAQNITPVFNSYEADWSWSANPQWTGATFSALGCLFYNTSSANRAVYVGRFPYTQSPAGQTLSIILPVNVAGTAVLAIG